MKISPTTLPEVLRIEPVVHRDARGEFFESFQARRYAEQGIDVPFVQDNVSYSEQGTLRGLHFQDPNAQGKLVQVLRGEIYDVAVDVRHGSPRFGHWVGVYLSAANHHQLWVPPGFAHGFLVLSPDATVSYKCTAYYDRGAEHSLRWDDRDVGIAWPLGRMQPRLSEKDAAGLTLADWANKATR